MKKLNIRKMTVTAVLAAVSTVLMFLNFSVPFMPPFIKMDLSEFPALLASFALGPVYGVIVSAIKNLVNLPFTTTLGVGELSNFLICSMFVFPAGCIYKFNRNRKGAYAGAVIGAVLAALLSVFTNYYIVYPFYTTVMPLENIIKAYQLINGNVENLWQAITWFNLPFTFIKCMLSVIVTFLIYKKLSPLLKGE